MFINYLFGQYKIEKIDLNQTMIINKIENWDNIEILRVIFKIKNELLSNSYIKFYFSDKEEIYIDEGDYNINYINRILIFIL